MKLLIIIFELIGILSFSISGSVVGIKKKMDMFGVCMLGITTAVGGGIIRDLMLGNTPPLIFNSPEYLFLAAAASCIVLIPSLRTIIENARISEMLIFVTDTIGLAAFVVDAVKIVISCGYKDNFVFVIFASVVTGVGGGVMRDMFAEKVPYIFSKHIYACAAIAGAVLCLTMWDAFGADISMLTGFAAIVIIRCLSARFNWNLPVYNPQK